MTSAGSPLQGPQETPSRFDEFDQSGRREAVSWGALTRRRFLQVLGLAALGATTGSARYVELSNDLEVSHTRLTLPGEGPGFRIAFIADVHAPQHFLDLDAVVRAANAWAPDVVLIVGDSINIRGDEELVSMYAPLTARIGKYATVGNWENWGLVRRKRLAADYDAAGVVFLDNAATALDPLGVHLVGLDERTNGWPNWDLVAAAPTDRPTLLMHHSPGAFDLLPAPDGATVLMLAGHTHGGQVALLGHPLILPPGCNGYVQGRYARGPHQMYVTRGLGSSHLPFRIGARPELAILDIRRAMVVG